MAYHAGHGNAEEYAYKNIRQHQGNKSGGGCQRRETKELRHHKGKIGRKHDIYHEITHGLSKHYNY